jgi:hypothetical protein
MLSTLRKMADTWPARILFMVLAAAFVGWGVSGKLNLNDDPTAVANVEGHAIANTDFDVAFRQDMAKVAQRYPDPSQIPPALRQQVAEQSLERLVTQQALADEAKRMGVMAPDSAVEKAIMAIPAFQGVNGKFDHATYVGLLSRNNLTPIQFQDDMRKDITKNQILTAVQAGAQPSKLLANMVFDYLYETRQADLVSITFASHAAPPPPPDATLQRFYANNLSRYTAPEYRHVKVVVLCPSPTRRCKPGSSCTAPISKPPKNARCKSSPPAPNRKPTRSPPNGAAAPLGPPSKPPPKLPAPALRSWMTPPRTASPPPNWVRPPSPPRLTPSPARSPNRSVSRS